MNAAKLKEVAARMRQGGNAAYVKVNQAPAGWDDVTIRSYDFLAASVLTWADEIEAIAAESPKRFVNGRQIMKHYGATEAPSLSAREREFYEASVAYAAWCETSNRGVAEVDTTKTFAWINRLGELQAELRAAYRALSPGVMETGEKK